MIVKLISTAANFRTAEHSIGTKMDAEPSTLLPRLAGAVSSSMTVLSTCVAGAGESLPVNALWLATRSRYRGRTVGIHLPLPSAKRKLCCLLALLASLVRERGSRPCPLLSPGIDPLLLASVCLLVGVGRCFTPRAVVIGV